MRDMQNEFDSLVAKTPLSDGLDRRHFMKTALGVGFASSVLPVAAQTVVKTDTDGLTAGPITIKVGDDELPVYRAQPKGKTDLPVILVISEIFGVHEHIADVARRFAKQGYLALAPELFFRQGDPKSYTTVAETMRQVVAKVPDEQVMSDLDACTAWAAKNNGDAGKLGITGFCWGGRITWLYSAHNPQVKAGVAWYGRLTSDVTPLTPKHPLDLAETLKVPVLGLYGAKDAGIPLDSVNRMKEALAKGKSKSEIVVYTDSGHAFHADYRPSYVEADAKDGWKRCLDWFKTHGVF
jgi:carboxymethylenebutenolidase